MNRFRGWGADAASLVAYAAIATVSGWLFLRGVSLLPAGSPAPENISGWFPIPYRGGWTLTSTIAGVLVGVVLGAIAARWAFDNLTQPEARAGNSLIGRPAVGIALLALSAVLVAVGGPRSESAAGSKAAELPPENTPVASAPAPKPLSLWREGQTLQLIGLNADAIEQYNAAIRLDPRFTEAYRSRASAFAEDGKLDWAAKDLDIAIYLDPDNYRLYQDRAFVFWELGNADKAIADLDVAISLNDRSPIGYFNRGLIRGMAGDLSDSIADFDAAIHLDPRNSDAYYNRGVSYARKNDLERALADFGEAIRLQPDHAGALLSRAQVAWTRGDAEGARADLEKALDVTWDPEAAGKIRGLLESLNQPGD